MKLILAVLGLALTALWLVGVFLDLLLPFAPPKGGPAWKTKPKNRA